MMAMNQRHRVTEIPIVVQKLEHWLLSSIIAKNELIEIAFDKGLSYTFFDDPRHVAIFALMTELHKKGSPITPESIMRAYEQLPDDFVGKGTLTSDYLTELVDTFSPLAEPFMQQVFEHIAGSHSEFMQAAHLYFDTDKLADMGQSEDIKSTPNSTEQIN